ncbi:hypothetical protein HanXRQr2_Chr03g0109221 [Helianthus annuus]|uniref:Uncharacterized protein n=1 Tax=Helianthus annuus TaxID=4232 RepID=A0A9K3JG00_HELAN|nr:hypothetical protein HanXRQr2_Chr03g0109221 [Helianthus annuus]
MNKRRRMNVNKHITEWSRTQSNNLFVHLVNRTKYLVRVRSFAKRTNIHELPVERFTNCSLNVRFAYNPNISFLLYTWSS